MRVYFICLIFLFSTSCTQNNSNPEIELLNNHSDTIRCEDLMLNQFKTERFFSLKNEDEQTLMNLIGMKVKGQTDSMKLRENLLIQIREILDEPEDSIICFYPICKIEIQSNITALIVERYRSIFPIGFWDAYAFTINLKSCKIIDYLHIYSDNNINILNNETGCEYFTKDSISILKKHTDKNSNSFLTIDDFQITNNKYFINKNGKIILK